ncbi:hypothetical protein TNCV_3735521 [Trichonephila clavipes]|nr:hypothetical protein TNCV_3735521 [Trichonephila clavipes]
MRNLINRGIYSELTIANGKSTSRALGDGPRNFEPWSSDDDDTSACNLSSNLHTTPTGERFRIDKFNVNHLSTQRVFSCLRHPPNYEKDLNIG